MLFWLNQIYIYPIGADGIQAGHSYLSLDDFYIDLRLADFVLREPDVVSLSDERLLTYWTDGF